MALVMSYTTTLFKCMLQSLECHSSNISDVAESSAAAHKRKCDWRNWHDIAAHRMHAKKRCYRAPAARWTWRLLFHTFCRTWILNCHQTLSLSLCLKLDSVFPVLDAGANASARDSKGVCAGWGFWVWATGRERHRQMTERGKHAERERDRNRVVGVS